MLSVSDEPTEIREKGIEMFRKILAAKAVRPMIAAAVLAAAPLLVAAPANALAVGQTVCYTADGTPVFNPPSEDGFEYCVTRPSTGGGGRLPQLCTITASTVSCTPIAPLNG
jgi:hypothetical protein